jgi:solute:Na+ symporter, SSS family
MIKFHFIDGVLIAAYLIFLLAVTWFTRREAKKDEDSYLLAGRKLTLPAFIATLVSTWYGGILGVGEYSFLYGISNWLVFGVPYYVAAILFALLLAKVARRNKIVSIPDQLEKAYGRGPALIGASIVFIMTVPAAYVLMIGILLKAIFGGSLLVWIIVGTLFSTLYVAFGGFNSVVRTDKIQFVLMYLGFALLLGFSVKTFGGWEYIKSNVPEAHLTWNGGMPVWSILVWYVLALSTLVEPGFYQRCFAAKSEKVAKNGIFIAILFWIFFDAMTTFCGLYARAALSPDIDPMLSYPLLASKILPPGILGIFILALLAVIMSTVDSYSFIAAQTLGRDIYARARGQLNQWSAKRIQWGLVASAIFAIILAIWKGSVIDIWHDLGSIGTPMLLFPLAGAFRNPPLFKAGFITPAMLLSGLSALIWTLTGSYGAGYPFGIEPIFIGLLIGALILIPSINRTKK